MSYSGYELTDTQCQPCGQFTPFESEFWGVVRHQCPDCLGMRIFCISCNRDHHMGGWNTCNPVRIRKSACNHSECRTIRESWSHIWRKRLNSSSTEGNQMDSKYGKIAYEAYCAKLGNPSTTGQWSPSWDDLPSAIKDAWKTAGEAVADEVMSAPEERC